MPLEIGVMLRGKYPFGVDMVAMADELVEQAKFADRLGYASITKGSHYSTPDYQALQQLPILARLTGRTTVAAKAVWFAPLHPRVTVKAPHLKR